MGAAEPARAAELIEVAQAAAVSTMMLCPCSRRGLCQLLALCVTVGMPPNFRSRRSSCLTEANVGTGEYDPNATFVNRATFARIFCTIIAVQTRSAWRS